MAYNLSISNTTVTLSPGTAFGFYGGSGSHGLRLENGATLTASGEAMNLCRFVRYNGVAADTDGGTSGTRNGGAAMQGARSCDNERSSLES